MLGVKILEEVTSPINGKITVLKSIGFGTYIQAEGLTQSGGVVHDVWKTTLRKLKKEEVKKCLILGLGGGSAATLVKRFWPKASITGVDIDQIMVNMGKKYLGLNEVDIKLKIIDAQDFLDDSPDKYDLILTDTYQGYDYPEKFETREYLQLVKSRLSIKGIAVFNRLYFDDKRPLAVKFGKKLEKVFAKVDVFYPEANIMFVCRE